jgi:hypothetical protein
MRMRNRLAANADFSDPASRNEPCKSISLLEVCTLGAAQALRGGRPRRGFCAASNGWIRSMKVANWGTVKSSSVLWSRETVDRAEGEQALGVELVLLEHQRQLRQAGAGDQHGQHLLADLVHRLGQQAQICSAEELHLVEQQQHAFAVLARGAADLAEQLDDVDLRIAGVSDPLTASKSMLKRQWPSPPSASVNAFSTPKARRIACPAAQRLSRSRSARWQSFATIRGSCSPASHSTTPEVIQPCSRAM